MLLNWCIHVNLSVFYLEIKRKIDDMFIIVVFRPSLKN